MLRRNGKVASPESFRGQLSLFDFARRGGSKQMYLTQYGLMAERHWREFRPQMVRALETKGTFMEALFEAQERTIEEMEVLTFSTE